jgi:hypothetical protein
VTSLADRYDAFERHRRGGRDAEARAAFLALAGLDEVSAEAVVGAAHPPTAPMIRYDVPRAVDVVALQQGARDVAKFEDLTLRTARSLEGALARDGLRSVAVGPYARRMDVALSTDAGLADRYTLIAGRGSRAHLVAEAERDRSAEGTRRAGLALGYPPCCVERFVALERTEEALRDGVNEATLRAFVDTGAPPWELNPLSSHALIGFMPCAAACPAALAFARRVYGALGRLRNDVAATVRATLARPVLFVRFPMFWVLDDARLDARKRLRYSRAVAHDDGSLAALGAWRDALLGDAVHRADAVSLDDRAVTLTREGSPVAAWGLRAPRVPRLVVFTGGDGP